MEVVYQRCCGIDVHKKMIVACFRDGRKKEIREFGTLTSELRELTSWLLDSGCEMIAMESTASYWKPLYNLFELSGLPAMVVNAHHMKSLSIKCTLISVSPVLITPLLIFFSIFSSFPGIPARKKTGSPLQIIFCKENLGLFMLL